MKISKKDLIKVLILPMATIGILTLSGLFGPCLRFVSETIRLEYSERVLTMFGEYHYYNPFPFPVFQELSCPIPDGKDMQPIHNLSVDILENESCGRNIPVRFFNGRFYFTVNAPGRSFITLRVTYSHGQLGPHCRYILKTTRPWKKPLEYGRYEFVCHGVQVHSSNYELKSDNKGVLFFERTNFFPEEDWNIHLIKQDQFQCTDETH